jgi:Na+/phosphate symporter
MGELIATLVEILVSLMVAILEALFLMAEVSATIIAYAISAGFRQKKRNQWAEKSWKKYLDLGISSLCLSSLIAVVVWLSWPSPKPPRRSVQTAERHHKFNVDLQIMATPIGTTNNTVTIAVKKSGGKMIFETSSLKDLGRMFRDKVRVVPPENKNRSTVETDGTQAILSGTNRPPSSELP